MGGEGSYLHILPLLRPRSEEVALSTVCPNDTAEAAGGVAHASRQDLTVQEGVHHRALPVAGATEKGNLGNKKQDHRATSP